MKTRASIKKRNDDCKIVRRKGRLFVINKKTLSLNCARVNVKNMQMIQIESFNLYLCMLFYQHVRVIFIKLFIKSTNGNKNCWSRFAPE